MSLTLAQIKTIEPGVAEVLRRARYFNGSSIWNHYESSKRKLEPLVGQSARKPELRTTEAHAVVYAELSKLMRSLDGMRVFRR